MTRHLVALDKLPVLFPIGIGEAIRRLMAKLVKAITSQKYLSACGSNNLCAWLKSGIKGAVHASEQVFGERNPPNAV